MDCYEINLDIPFHLNPKSIKESISNACKDYTILRFVSLKSDGKKMRANVLLSKLKIEDHDIFKLNKRASEKTEEFNTCFLIPTGIGCEVGGHAGDANTALRLIAESCDQVITHPNVVNASDINEMPDNCLYVEGSHVTEFLQGQIGLVKTRANKILVLIDAHNAEQRYVDLTINSVNAARATLGVDSNIEFINEDFYMNAFTLDKLAQGEMDGLHRLVNKIEQTKHDFDAIAVVSPIRVEEGTHEVYSKSNGDMVNPWGGVESMLTHFLSAKFKVPTAHAPMMESSKVANIDYGVVDSRIAPEIVSNTFMHCIMKGLARAPRISSKGGLRVESVSALVVPYGTLGLPIISALHQGIPVVAVKNKNTMKNEIVKRFFDHGKFFIAENYLEASGILNCLKSGISIESVRRPIKTLRREDTC